MESPGDGRKEATAKRPRKGKLTYAETCRKEMDIKATDRDMRDGSEGWTTISGKRRKKKGPDGTPSSNARVNDMREKESGESCAKN
jgi:hypothetical protein